MLGSQATRSHPDSLGTASCILGRHASVATLRLHLHLIPALSSQSSVSRHRHGWSGFEAEIMGGRPLTEVGLVSESDLTRCSIRYSVFEMSTPRSLFDPFFLFMYQNLSLLDRIVCC